ncbi:MAG: fatty acid desaturase [Verrucomicrobia bacterium]|nr:fatty acid desaturase [Verrucomicrobiota bacterium]
MNTPAPAARVTGIEIRKILQPYASQSYLLPISIFTADFAAYGFSIFLTIYLDSAWLRLGAGIATGVATGGLFLIGHDACHHSYTPSRWLNAVLGRIAFLPMLHPFSLWALGHNRIHHRYTNLRPHDYPWVPFDKDEFTRLPAWRRALERIYRTVPGQALYYIVEIWWKKMFFPNRRQVAERKAAYFWDSLLVAVYLAGLLAALVAAGRVFGKGAQESVFFGWLVPFYVWNWLLNFVIYQQHTHPAVAWHDQEDEWEYMEAQIDSSPHFRFPPLVGFILHNIMEHTAHHAATSIPLYRLKEAQTALERAYPDRVKVLDWTWAGYVDAVRRCKLYDYRRHVWQDFQGRDTTEPTVQQQPPK